MSPRAHAPDRSGEGFTPSTATEHEPLMTHEQAVRLKELAHQALELEAFHAGLTQAEAARRIRALEVKLKSMDGPPHVM
jgi:hypothetical protein